MLMRMAKKSIYVSRAHFHDDIKHRKVLLILNFYPFLKEKYPNFEVGLKCIIMVFPYLLLCSYMKENAM